VRILSFALAAALTTIAGPAYAGQVPPQGQALMTYNFRGYVKFHGPVKAADFAYGQHAGLDQVS